MARHSISIAGIFFLAMALAASPATYEPEVGEAFPNLLLPSLEDGGPLSVGSFRGQKLVLHVWASW